MKVAWLQDINPFDSTYTGGAEQTDRAHIVHGLRMGHDIEVVTPMSPLNVSWADLVVVSNAAAFRVEELKAVSAPYVLLLHDYWGLCRWRLFYPMLDKCRDCYLKPRFLPLLFGSELIVWLSPLHRESWLFTYPELEHHPHALVPSAIDVDQFFDMGLQRHGAVAVNSGLKFKGYDQVRDWAEEHGEAAVTLVGPVEGPMPPNVALVGHVPVREMNHLYNRHERLLHLPQNPMPFDRTVAEAYLAGCEVQANELVGALSWPFFREGRDGVRQALKTASSDFWGEVGQCLT